MESFLFLQQVCKDVHKNGMGEIFSNWPAIAKTFFQQREVLKEMIHVDSSCILVSYGRGLNEKIGRFLPTAHTRPCYKKYDYLIFDLIIILLVMII